MKPEMAEERGLQLFAIRWLVVSAMKSVEVPA